MAQQEHGTLVGQRLGGYELLRLLGAGGMAEVYVGLDLGLRREVAVKVLPRAYAADSDYVGRFRNEARRVANLRHPHIIPVYFAGEQDGLLYMVMPILHGSLADRVRRLGPPTPEQAVALVLQVADGLAAAHHIGVIHRDVKPENILIDDAGNPVLADFGLARELFAPQWDSRRTAYLSRGLPVGTPAYMAPEQFLGGKVGPQADIFGLGSVLYELLVGQSPREAANPSGDPEMMFALRPFPTPGERNSRVWPSLDLAILRALEFQPQDRYVDMEQFRDVLSRALVYRSAPASSPRAATGVPRPATGAPRARTGAPRQYTGVPRPTSRPITAQATQPPLHPGQQLSPQAGGRRDWRRYWWVGLVALALLGVAGASLGSILRGQSVMVAFPSGSGDGGNAGAATTATGSGKPSATASDHGGVPLATERAATAFAGTATVNGAVVVHPGSSPVPTIAPVPTLPLSSTTPVSGTVVPTAPLLAYIPPGPGNGPGDVMMGTLQIGTYQTCLAVLNIGNYTNADRAWEFASGPTSAPWTYAVTDQTSGQTWEFGHTLPSINIPANTNEMVTITYAQGASDPACSGTSTFAPQSASIVDEAASTAFSFYIRPK